MQPSLQFRKLCHLFVRVENLGAQTAPCQFLTSSKLAKVVMNLDLLVFALCFIRFHIDGIIMYATMQPTGRSTPNVFTV